MPALNGNIILIGSLIGGGLFVLLTVMTVVSRFYRRCGADEALVRTGSGGNKVVIGGGVLVYPILHQLMRVSLRSVKLSVERSAKNALVTADKIKANVTTELYIKVEPLADDVMAAARTFGERNLDEHAIGDLIEGKLTDALRSVAANQTFMSLHGKRKDFAEHIQAALSEELKKNGLTLENVSITAMSMVPVKDLDEHDVFDAEGLRAITESVQTNREKTNQIQREKENQIHAQNVTARMRQLQLEQDQKQSEADQGRKVSEYAAIQSAETAKAVYIQEQARDLAGYEKQRAVETARIVQEQGIAVAMAGKQRAEREALIAAEKGQQAAEIAKQREIEAAMIEKDKTVQAAEIDRQKAIEVARICKVIAVTQGEEQQARAAAAKAIALAEEETATQAIVTVELTAKADRERQISTIRAQAEADQQRIGADGRAIAAEREADAMIVLANAVAKKGAAEAQARRNMIDAENAMAMKFVMRDVALRAIEMMPDLARELMAPAKAITEIKVLQMNGTGSNGGANGNGSGAVMGSAMSPILKTIMEAGAAYPMLRELMAFAQVDGGKLSEKAKGVLGELSGELEGIMKEGTAVPLELTRSQTPPTIEVDVKPTRHHRAGEAAGE